MIRGYSAELQALLGTLFTWGLTALGAGIVFLVPRNLSRSMQTVVLDLALGFSAGVMLAASFWSLLAPAIELTEHSSIFSGAWAWVPAAISFLVGSLFVYCCNVMLPEDSIVSFASQAAANKCSHQAAAVAKKARDLPTTLRKRRTPHLEDLATEEQHTSASDLAASSRRIFLLVIAITVHNFPEGLAVGVGFGAVGVGAPGSSFDAARALTIGIGLQNFPEGLAVSLPLLRLGFSPWKSFFYGQLSGMVEPLSGLLGAYLISYAAPLLPWALGFAAGAMIFVVVDDIVPEAHAGREKNPIASVGAMLGFVIMMALDVGLG
eukprot:gb/GEZN01009515.1/.p1 GENE.gb/GEZN01009515.1/~~gb/GEZN01009515.1/.p1  ORF type:complete len:321 (+),score=27.58 gb/GEZN01009515.1/:159-1121(+)